MKKIFCILLFSFYVTFAHSQSNISPSEDPTAHFPRADDGVKIVPLSEMNLPDSEKKRVLSDIQELKANGFIKSDAHHANQLLYMGQGGIVASMDSTGSDPYDTKHFKKNLSQIRLAFPFHGIPFVNQKDIIGFSVLGGWKGTGWSGVSQIFNYKGIGTCQFSLMNMSFDGGTGEQVMAELVRYDVNQKPTTLSVEGNEKKQGFLYTIRWSDKINYYDLECANKSFDQKVIKNLIKLAQETDRALNPS